MRASAGESRAPSRTFPAMGRRAGSRSRPGSMVGDMLSPCGSVTNVSSNLHHSPPQVPEYRPAPLAEEAVHPPLLGAGDDEGCEGIGVGLEDGLTHARECGLEVGEGLEEVLVDDVGGG